jgi:hypothetical protein
MNWELFRAVRNAANNSTGAFTETFTFRAISTTPVLEPSSSLVIPSGVAMLLALAKLRGVGLGRVEPLDIIDRHKRVLKRKRPRWV